MAVDSFAQHCFKFCKLVLSTNTAPSRQSRRTSSHASCRMVYSRVVILNLRFEGYNTFLFFTGYLGSDNVNIYTDICYQFNEHYFVISCSSVRRSVMQFGHHLPFPYVSFHRLYCVISRLLFRVSVDFLFIGYVCVLCLFAASWRNKE